MKFFLHVSKEEQKKRFLARLDTPAESGSSTQPTSTRGRAGTTTWPRSSPRSRPPRPRAPWHVIPADHKWLTQALIVSILVDTIQALHLSWPEVTEKERKANADARRLLDAEA